MNSMNGMGDGHDDNGGGVLAELPVKGRLFEMRFESIGGLGAHAAGQILTAAAVLGLGLNGAHFSSYGSEKKGSVVRSYVRLGPSAKPIRTNAPVDRPDVVVVFHNALLKASATLAGLRAGGTLVYTDAEGSAPPAELAGLPESVRVVRVDALRIAAETKSRPNAVLMGTLSGLFPFLRPSILMEFLRREFASKHPSAVASNERAFSRGASEFEIIMDQGKLPGDVPVASIEPMWGYETAPLGGVIPLPGNTIWNDLSTARTGWIPVLNSETCIHCGLCDMVCPDFCLVWEADSEIGIPNRTRLMGIDYRYCKGCMRCVETCPSQALTREVETDGMAARLRVPLFPELIS